MVPVPVASAQWQTDCQWPVWQSVECERALRLRCALRVLRPPGALSRVSVLWTVLLAFPSVLVYLYIDPFPDLFRYTGIGISSMLKNVL